MRSRDCMIARTRGCSCQSAGCPQACHVDRGLDRLPIRAQVLAPIHGIFIADEAERGARLGFALVETRAVLIHHGGGVGGAEHAFGRELLRIQLPGRGFLANDLIHERLGRRRFVGLVVAVPPITDQIDHHILVEFHPVLESEADDEADGFGIVRVDVQNRRFDHLGDV